MIRARNFFLYFIVLFFAGTLSAQQYPQYSGYMFNRFAINPAYAGNYNTFQATAMIRNQWVGIQNAPNTSSLSFHGTLKNEKVALGFNVFSDAIGFSKTNAVFGTYAYRLIMPSGTLSFGLRMGVANVSYNWEDVDVKDKVDALLGAGVTNVSRVLSDAGVYYHNNTFYAGLSATNLIGQGMPTLNYSQLLLPHLFLTAGKSFSISDNLIINPSVLIKLVQGAMGIDINCNFLISNKLWLGLSGRIGYGYVLLMQYNITEKFKIGYAYDLGRNDIGIIGGSSHEIMLGYNFSLFSRKMQSFRFL
ncbi:MAG: type IX secretion system membrane protein PorP/SprF [Bacteroidia bacterium]|nr:type IX secretion system membrane protein PorP/SprF [Bacteroidia bacterium]